MEHLFSHAQLHLNADSLRKFSEFPICFMHHAMTAAATDAGDATRKLGTWHQRSDSFAASIQEYDPASPSSTHFTFSIDLVNAALKELNFLLMIDKKTPVLYELHIVRNAVLRYEQYWLPLAARQNDVYLVPPLDVHWVWHVHMLSVRQYQHDSIAITGKVVDHCALDAAEIDKHFLRSLNTWQSHFPLEPYDFLLAARRRKFLQYDQRSCFNFYEAVQRQRNFNFQVALPHYASQKLLSEAVTRYSKFLYLKKLYPNAVLSPPWDIRLMWHTHMVHLSAYEKDIRRIFGHFLPLDELSGETVERPEMLQNEANTSRMWSRHFADKLTMRGVTFRGHHAPATLGIECAPPSAPRQGTIHLLSISLKGVPPGRKYIELAISYGKLLVARHRAETTLEEQIHRQITVAWRKDPTVLPIMTSDAIPANFHFNCAAPQQLSVQVRLFDYSFFNTRKQELRLTGLTSLSEMLPTDDTTKLPQNLTSVDLFQVRSRASKQPFEEEPVRAVISSFLCSNRKLVLQLGSFASLCLVSEDDAQLDKLCLAASLHKTAYTKKRGPLICATHRMLDAHSTSPLQIKVFHSASLLLSLVLVYEGSRLLAMAHLIGPETLPAKAQLDAHLQFLPTISAPNERAVCVMNHAGDYFVIKGRWSDYQPPVKGQQQPPTMVMNTYGKLNIELFNLTKGTVQKFHLPGNDGSSKFFVGDAHTSLSSSVIKCTSLNFAESVCGVMSIALLFVLCNPNKSRHNLTLDNVPCSKCPLLLAAGFGAETPSNRYLVDQLQRASEHQLNTATEEAEQSCSQPIETPDADQMTIEDSQ